MASICRAFVAQPTLAVLQNAAGTLGRDQQSPCRDHHTTGRLHRRKFHRRRWAMRDVDSKETAENSDRYRESVSITYQSTAHRDVGG